MSSGALELCDLIAIKDRIEKGLKASNIHSNVRASNAPKKFSRNFPKKKEGEANAVMRGWKKKS